MHAWERERAHLKANSWVNSGFACRLRLRCDWSSCLWCCRSVARYNCYGTWYSRGMDPQYRYDCVGNEATLRECSSRVWSCSKTYTVNVICDDGKVLLCVCVVCALSAGPGKTFNITIYQKIFIKVKLSFSWTPEHCEWWMSNLIWCMMAECLIAFSSNQI